MSLFVCDKCGCVENTALSGYWWKPIGAPALCSACDPQFKGWHGRFSRHQWDGRQEVINREYGCTNEAVLMLHQKVILKQRNILSQEEKVVLKIYEYNCVEKTPVCLPELIKQVKDEVGPSTVIKIVDKLCDFGVINAQWENQNGWVR